MTLKDQRIATGRCCWGRSTEHTSAASCPVFSGSQGQLSPRCTPFLWSSQSLSRVQAFRSGTVFQRERVRCVQASRTVHIWVAANTRCSRPGQLEPEELWCWREISACGWRRTAGLGSPRAGRNGNEEVPVEEETSRMGLRIGLETCGGAEREVEGTGAGVWCWAVTQRSQGGLGWPVVRPGRSKWLCVRKVHRVAGPWRKSCQARRSYRVSIYA